MLKSMKTRQPGTNAYRFRGLIATVLNSKMEKVLRKHTLVQQEKNLRLRGEPDARSALLLI